MLVYIIPKFKDVFVSMGAEIPAITQFALNLSAFLTNNYIYIISAIIIFIVVFIFSYKKRCTIVCITCNRLYTWYYKIFSEKH